jgi:hypothetical protein
MERSLVMERARASTDALEVVWATENAVRNASAPAGLTTRHARALGSKQVIELAVLSQLPISDLATTPRRFGCRKCWAKTGLPRQPLEFVEITTSEQHPKRQGTLCRHSRNVPRGGILPGKHKGSVNIELKTVFRIVSKPSSTVLQIEWIDRFQELEHPRVRRILFGITKRIGWVAHSVV